MHWSYVTLFERMQCNIKKSISSRDQNLKSNRKTLNKRFSEYWFLEMWVFLLKHRFTPHGKETKMFLLPFLNLCICVFEGISNILFLLDIHVQCVFRYLFGACGQISLPLAAIFCRVCTTTLHIHISTWISFFCVPNMFLHVGEECAANIWNKKKKGWSILKSLKN